MKHAPPPHVALARGRLHGVHVLAAQPKSGSSSTTHSPSQSLRPLGHVGSPDPPSTGVTGGGVGGIGAASCGSDGGGEVASCGASPSGAGGRPLPSNDVA